MSEHHRLLEADRDFSRAAKASALRRTLAKLLMWVVVGGAGFVVIHFIIKNW